MGTRRGAIELLFPSKFEIVQYLQLLTSSKDYVPSEMIEKFIANDLLQLRANCLLPKLLWPLDYSENVLVQQNRIASLLNAVVSYKEGRKYFDEISMFEILTANALGNSSVEKNTLEHLIAVMAKLSVNTFHRNDFGKWGKFERINQASCPVCKKQP